jgi:hypothetical protein
VVLLYSYFFSFSSFLLFLTIVFISLLIHQFINVKFIGAFVSFFDDSEHDVYFIPLSPCTGDSGNCDWLPSSRVTKTTDHNILPFSCDVDLLHRWMAVKEILSDTTNVKIVHNMQIALLPLLTTFQSITLHQGQMGDHAVMGSSSSSSSFYLFDVKVAASLLNSDQNEEELELHQLYKNLASSSSLDEVIERHEKRASSQPIGITTRMIMTLCDEMRCLHLLHRNLDKKLHETGE